MADAVPIDARAPRGWGGAPTQRDPLSVRSLVLVFLLFIVATSSTFTTAVFPTRFAGRGKIAPSSALLHALVFVALYAVLTVASNAGVI